jgi:hypothetical protein
MNSEFMRLLQSRRRSTSDDIALRQWLEALHPNDRHQTRQSQRLQTLESEVTQAPLEEWLSQIALVPGSTHT